MWLKISRVEKPTEEKPVPEKRVLVPGEIVGVVVVGTNGSWDSLYKTEGTLEISENPGPPTTIFQCVNRLKELMG